MVREGLVRILSPESRFPAFPLQPGNQAGPTLSANVMFGILDPALSAIPNLATEVAAINDHFRSPLSAYGWNRKAARTALSRGEASRQGTALFAHVWPTLRRSAADGSIAKPGVPAQQARHVWSCVSETTGGTSGGTPRDKDQEIRVRMGNSRFRLQSERERANGDVSKACVENTGFILAPQVGFEPTTLRLTAECSTIELLRSKP